MAHRSLPEDFPGLAALQDAGEATPAKVRKRIDDDTLTEIPGIGEATADKIKEAFAATTEDDAGANDQDGKKTDQTDAAAASTAADQLEAGEQTRTNSPTAGETLLNTEGMDLAAQAAGAADMAKPGAVKNEELPNHALDDLTPAERVQAGINQTIGEKVAYSGAVFVHDPAGPYASREAVRIPPERGRIKIEAIGFVSPQKGMMVKHGDDVYNIQEDLGPDARGDDWLKVRSPNTGRAFIE
jgi:hypothetical protein